MEQILKENYSDTTFEIMINIKKIQNGEEKVMRVIKGIDGTLGFCKNNIRKENTEFSELNKPFNEFIRCEFNGKWRNDNSYWYEDNLLQRDYFK